MATHFTLHSKDLHGQFAEKYVFNDNGCTGDNVSPQLRWTDAPQGTKSFVLIAHDPDAPTPGGWYHWCIFDIPADVTELPTGAATDLPDGVISAKVDFGFNGYGGPCPPPGHGAHAYHFTVYALSTDSLGLDEGATPSMVAFVLREHLLAKATLTAYYEIKE